jgi:hypothetical protein
MLEVFSIFALSIIIFQWWIYNDKRSFKKYVLTDFKGKSKFFVFMYKFLALVYIEYLPGTGQIFVNLYKKKNISLFGKKYMKITFLCTMFSYISCILLISGFGYMEKSDLFFLTKVKNQERSLDFFSGNLIKIEKIENKEQLYYVLLSNQIKEKNFVVKLSIPIELNSFFKIGYFKKYDFNKFKEIESVVSVDINNKSMKNLEDYLSKLKISISRTKSIAIYGIYCFLFMYFLLWIRYKKYGFIGIDKLIKIKKKQFQNNIINNIG